MKKRLGEMLLERGLIDVDQLNAALAHQRQWGVRLGSALVTKGFVAEGMLTHVLSESLGIPMVDLATVVVEQRAIQLLPRRIAEQHEVLPIAVREQSKGRKFFYIAMADPLNATAIDEIGFTTDSIVKPAIAQISSLQQALRRYYGGERIEISPLLMTTPMRGGPRSEPPSGPMTIITGHGDEVVVNPAAQAPSPMVPGMTGGYPMAAPLPPPDYAGVAALSMPMPGSGVPVVPSATPRILPRPADLEELEALERKFWALMRVLTRRGVVTKEEFLAELRNTEAS